MTRQKTRIIATTVVSLMLLAIVLMPVQSSAAEIAPFYDNTSTVAALMSFSGNTASCTASVLGKSGTTSITGTMTLYRKVTGSTSEYTRLTSWPISGSSYVSQNEKYSSATTGYTYYLTVSATVVRNGTSENVSASTTANH